MGRTTNEKYVCPGSNFVRELSLCETADTGHQSIYSSRDLQTGVVDASNSYENFRNSSVRLIAAAAYDVGVILVGEPNTKFARELREALNNEQLAAAVERTGRRVLRRLFNDKFTLAILGLPLSDTDIFETLRVIRERSPETRVLLLGPDVSLEARVNMLNAGADDYQVKPVAVPELVARTRALLRRVLEARPGIIRSGDLTMDLVGRKVQRNGVLIRLTQTEFDLLRYLLEHKEHVVTRDVLSSDVLNKKNCSQAVCNLLDVHVSRLRRKLDAGRARKLIHTVRGEGFTLREGLYD